MALIDLIRPEIIKIPLESKSKEGVLRELLQLLQDAGQLGRDTVNAFDRFYLCHSCFFATRSPDTSNSPMLY